MTERSPLLGTAHLQSLQTPKDVDDLTPSTCFNFSRFQSLMKQFRALDDSVIMRINRSHALNRARDPSYAVVDDKECAALWSDLASNWQGREKIVRYCVEVAESPHITAASVAASDAQASAQMVEEPFTRRVLAQQMRNELAVETIIRRRTMAEFLRRCASFTPPRDTLPAEDLASLPAPTRERLA